MKCDLCGEEGVSSNEGVHTAVKDKPSYFICHQCLIENSTKRLEEIIEMIENGRN
jgi:hypothetical protein